MNLASYTIRPELCIYQKIHETKVRFFLTNYNSESSNFQMQLIIIYFASFV